MAGTAGVFAHVCLPACINICVHVVCFCLGNEFVWVGVRLRGASHTHTYTQSVVYCFYWSF